MIVGIGTDIVQIKRIEQVFEKYQCKFKDRLLSSCEIKKLNSLPQHKHINFLAKRFAAKEAISKAFGTGISEKLSFKDIAILNDAKGKPYVEILNDKFHELYSKKDIQIDISMSDDYPFAIAFSIISSDN